MAASRAGSEGEDSTGVRGKAARARATRHGVQPPDLGIRAAYRLAYQHGVADRLAAAGRHGSGGRKCSGCTPWHGRDDVDWHSESLAILPDDRAPLYRAIHLEQEKTIACSGAGEAGAGGAAAAAREEAALAVRVCIRHRDEQLSLADARPRSKAVAAD